MVQTRCVRIRLKAGNVDRAREWAAEINRRKAESLETLREEGVLVESVFLERTSEDDFLVYYMKAEDFNRANSVSRESMHPIDLYHRRFKAEAWASQDVLELLVDLDASEGA